MALFGAALAKEILGYDDANKAFRPWWDTTQDFLMYGMIMLGKFEASSIDYIHIVYVYVY